MESARYRFHGQFVSAAKAASLANLKNASNYLTSESSYAGRKIVREGYRTAESLERSGRRELKQEAARAFEQVKAVAEKVYPRPIPSPPAIAPPAPPPVEIPVSGAAPPPARIDPEIVSQAQEILSRLEQISEVAPEDAIEEIEDLRAELDLLEDAGPEYWQDVIDDVSDRMIEFERGLPDEVLEELEPMSAAERDAFDFLSDLEDIGAVADLDVETYPRKAA